MSRVNRFREMHGLEPLEIETDSTNGSVSVKLSSGAVVRLASSGDVKKTIKSGAGCCGGSSKNRIEVTTTKTLSTQKPITKRQVANVLLSKKPSFISRAVQYAESIAKHIADDGTPTAPADLTFRESCCANCPYNVNDVCALCSCPLKKNLLNQGKLAWRSEQCPVGRWFRQTDKAQPLVDPIRNLIFHIYPRIGCEWNWHRHIKHIRDNDHIWNGKRIISIMTGDGLVAPEVVQQQFDGIRVDRWIIMPNMKIIGETAPFILCLKQVESINPNEMTMFGHTKGITHDKNGKEQIWSEQMWATCTQDLKSIDDALASHWFVGPFKRHMRLLKSMWHYSGAFFWLRHKDIFSKPWQKIIQQRAGLEGWPGSVCDNSNAAVIFHDDPPVSFLDQRYWDDEVIPEFNNWKESRGIV
jgi:hypothetical protein